METKDNDQPVPAVPRESMAGAVTIESESPTLPPSSPELAPAPAPLTAENDQPAPAVPRESMAGARLVDEAPSSPALSELEQPPPAVPRESMAGARLVDEAPSSPALPELEQPPAAPSRVRALPRRPRIRASYYYDQKDQLQLELTLMDERRDLIHRMTLQPENGGALARIFEALVAIGMQAAAKAGVFGKALEPSAPESKSR